jgi:hypothetical protein
MFIYTITRGAEAKTVALRKSNPQGWLWDAVREAFPEVASSRAIDVMRLRLIKPVEAVEAWHCSLADPEADLVIHVVKSRP